MTERSLQVTFRTAKKNWWTRGESVVWLIQLDTL
jgi:hypothetical protein